MTNVPFFRSYWVEPGRLLAGCYPGGQDPRDAETKLAGLIECGVMRVINLMEADEVNHAGKAFVAYEPRLENLARQRDRSVECLRYSIQDGSVPSPAEMARILDAIDEALARGQVGYVHCWGGRGRTGTVIACYLRRTRGLAPADALAAVAKLTEHRAEVFWPTPETSIQHRFVHSWKEHR